MEEKRKFCDCPDCSECSKFFCSEMDQETEEGDETE